MQSINPLLARAAILMRAGRKSFWDEHTYGIRLSRHRGRAEAGLWFRTRGCRYDKAGSCVMCDYGAGPATTSAEEMIEFVRQGLDVLPEGLYHLLVSPLGSFLDAWEVPKEARNEILRLMAETDIDTFAFESRAETMTDEEVVQCCSCLGNRGLKVYLGLESSSPWISRYCINKAQSIDVFEQAVQILNRHKVITSANVLIGAPFLTTLETIEDALQSVTWAFAKGVDECNLFPTHVKQATLLCWLCERGICSPTSLWSLVEVLRRLGPEIVCTRIKFSWYKTYGSENVVHPPTTCSTCSPEIVHHLDQFYETNDFEWIEKLVSFSCQCKDVWRSRLETRPVTSILDRSIAAHRSIGLELLDGDWWQCHGEELLLEMRENAALFPSIVSNVPL